MGDHPEDWENDNPQPNLIEGGQIITGGNVGIFVPCGAAAPLVANGAGFIGCQLGRGHTDNHSVTVTWR